MINGLIEKEFREINDVVDALCEQNAGMNKHLVMYGHFLDEVEKTLKSSAENSGIKIWLLNEIADLRVRMEKV